MVGKNYIHYVGQLEENKVIIWLLDLNKTVFDLAWLVSLLSDSELKKSQKLVFDKDKKRYIVSHGILRILLGKYIGLPPGFVEYRFNRYGKPELNVDINPEKIKFNLSHSHEKILFAFSRGRELGVDIEYLDPKFPTSDISKRFFSPQEVQELINLPKEQQIQGFFKCWTQKEAYIKAKGMGLSIPLDSFDVSVSPVDPAGLISNKNEPLEIFKWKIQEIQIEGNYASAICAEGNDWETIVMTWL
jgi:4'-phosphopantetheinyl transferase